jgi:hypothetical protein
MQRNNDMWYWRAKYYQLVNDLLELDDKQLCRVTVGDKALKIIKKLREDEVYDEKG